MTFHGPCSAGFTFHFLSEPGLPFFGGWSWAEGASMREGLHGERGPQGGKRKETATGEGCSRSPPGRQAAGKEARACCVPALGCAGIPPFSQAGSPVSHCNAWGSPVPTPCTTNSGLSLKSRAPRAGVMWIRTLVFTFWGALPRLPPVLGQGLETASRFLCLYYTG